ncbi:FAD-binding oxidoreductase [Herbiconiux sp. KACC 21604]|uniref:FAD-binding oxidoreductase n=1 Tax=unclassified Herbiconiux TaxID=2618217 RepID=UPI00149316C8|nr:FAD-binding oxidoreductase [Herbiconiux sp. SALV-R1]QJU54791.1 FAD-binding oxidoreductase [Herbiconiux sp. SALV-R1]WPO85902.1 FAD-binding oxidoreductase [Herbiconiux sp. KACC 21604]
MTFTADDLDTLSTSLDGPLFARGDAALPAEVAGFNTTVVHDPDLVVGAASEADVVAAVRFATRHGLPVRVLATGHGGFSPVVDGVLVTTSRLDQLDIDPETRRATVGAGLRWRPVVAAAAEHGLAPVTGSSDSVGVVGYTTGGGLGPFARTLGFSSDWVRSFRVVTAGGELVTASESSHPEMFWALRGGKGGLGVVTSIEFELVPLTSFYGGSLFFDAEHIPAVLRAWAAFTETAPVEATSSVAVVRFPPFDEIPAPLRGKTAVSLRFAYLGDSEAGAAVFQPLRDVAPAFLGAVDVMPAAAVAMVHNDPDQPGPVWDRGMMLDSVDDGFVDAFLEAFGPGRELPLIAAELRHVGGATSRDVPGGSAVGGRDAGYTMVMIGAPDPGLFDTVLPRVADGITELLRPWISASTNINFAGDLSVPGAYEAAWPADVFGRLAEVRRSYDPAGVFPYPPRAAV